MARWFILKRNATLHNLFPISKSIVVNLFDLLGVGFKKHVVIFRKNQQADWYYNVAGIDSVAEFMLRKTLKTKGFNERIEEKWQKYAQKLEKLFLTIENNKLGKVNNKDLCVLYKNLLSSLESESALGTLSDFLSSELIPKEISKYFKKINIQKTDFNRMIGVVTTSIYKSPYTQEQEDFLKIAIKYTRGKNINNDLSNHGKKYWYIQNDYKVSKRLSPDDFRKLVIRFVKERHDPENEYIDFKKKINKLTNEKKKLTQLAEMAGQKEFVKILKMIDIHVKLWDLKKVMMQKTFYYLDLILKEIGQRCKLSFDDAKWLTPEEIIFLFKSGSKEKLREEAKTRKKLCVLEITTKRIKIITVGKAKKIINNIEGEFFDAVGNEIKGKIGNVGKAKGAVKIILNPRNRVKFKSGEILVTGMTTPDFIPFMKVTKAIITDEGGITCHAAIVSRELGIPCVIGTKIATKILKDGDLIEVDADKGVVKKLK